MGSPQCGSATAAADCDSAHQSPLELSFRASRWGSCPPKLVHTLQPHHQRPRTKRKADRRAAAAAAAAVAAPPSCSQTALPLATITLGGAAHTALGSAQKQQQAVSYSKHEHLEPLPLGTQRGRGPQKHERRYVWDGKKVVAVDEERLGRIYTPAGRLLQWWSDVRDSLCRAFLPDRRDVTPDYWEWMRWRLTQRFFGSTMQNLATQSLLLALGMGAKRTIAASAAINWLLKDGVGRIARMTLATNFGQSFDSDLKRIRFLTSTIFDTSLACEFITPFFPQHFLALASVSNVGKALALAAFVATAPAFQQALCTGGNIADVTAKGQAQHMVMDMFALGLSASAMYLAKNMKTPALLPLAAYPFLAIADVYCIYHELKAVQLRTLNRERAELVAEQWVTMGKVPHTEEICERETLLLPPNVCSGALPLTITSVEGLITHPSQLQHLMSRYKKSNYMMALQEQKPRLQSSPAAAAMLPGALQRFTATPPRLVVSLSEGAKGSDVLTAVLEAAYVRQAITERVSHQLSASSSSSSSGGGNSSCRSWHRSLFGWPRSKSREGVHSSESTEVSGASGRPSPHSSSSNNICSRSGAGVEGHAHGVGDARGNAGSSGHHWGWGSSIHSSSNSSSSSSSSTNSSSSGVNHSSHNPQGFAIGQHQLQLWHTQHDEQAHVHRSRAHATAAAQLRSCFPLSSKEVEALAQEAHQKASRDAKRFVREVQAAGWKVDPFLLSTTEKEGYVLMPKKK